MKTDTQPTPMGAAHSSAASGTATSDPALAHALQIVSPTPISPFSGFWQHALSSLSFSLTAGLEPEEVAAELERAATQMAANTLTSGNLAAMCTVICMALEQYALVQQHAADTAAASESHPPRRRQGEGDDEDEKALAPPEPLHTLFERIYSPAHQAAIGFAASFVPPVAPASASGSRASLLSSPPSAWLLDLITLTRLFLQHIVSEVEYGAHKIQLLSLRAPAPKPAASAGAPQATAPSALPQFPTHTAPLSIAAAVAAADDVPLHSDLSYRLVHALLTALTDIPLSDSNSELHVELSNLALVLFSAQMFVPLAPQYQHANIFLVHAVCGPFAREEHEGSPVGRCADLVRKLLSNCLAPTRALHEQRSKHLAASRMASSHAASVVLNSDRGSSFGHATPAHETTMTVLSSPLSVSALGSPSSEVDPRLLGNVSPIARVENHAAGTQFPSQPNVGSSLTRRFQQLAGAGGRVAPPLLKRLGSRLYSLLLLPVTKIFKFFFPSADGSSSVSAAATLLHDPLSIRSNLLLLLLAHQNCRALQAAADGVSDPDALPYRHRHAGRFDWRQWREEHEARIHSNGSTAPAVPFKPTMSASTAASSIRMGTPAVLLPSLASSSGTLMSPSSAQPVPLDDNPYARALALLRDDAWDADAAEEEELARTPSSILSVSITPSPPPAFSGGAPTLSFSLLYDLLCSSLPSEGASLLLYTLLQSNARFREFILVKTDVDLLVLPIIRGLYLLYASNTGIPTSPGVGSGSSSSSALSLSFTRNRVYMLLILLLMLSEDRGFVQGAHLRLILKSAPWYVETNLVNISLASTMMLVLLKVAHANSYAHAGARDSYVQTNALAILANLAHNASQHESDMHALAATVNTVDGSNASAGAVARSASSGVRLHANVSLKLISLLAILAKKFAKIKEKAARERAAIAAQRAEQARAAAAAAASSAPAPTSAAASFASKATSALDASRINLAPPSALHVAHTAATVPPTHASATAAPAVLPPPAEDDPSIEVSAATQEDLSTFTALIRLLLEIVVSSLSLRSLDSNIYLLYSLVQSRARALEPFGASAEFGDLADPLLALCDKATEIIDRAQNAPTAMTKSAGTKDGATVAPSPALSAAAPVPFDSSASPPPPLLSLSVEELMALLKSSSRLLKASMSPVLIAGAPGGANGAAAGGWRSFSYEEQPNADEFFLPFLWELAWGATGGLLRGGAGSSVSSAAGAQIVIFQTGEAERLEREQAALEAQRDSIDAHTQRVHDSLAACGLIDPADSSSGAHDECGSVTGSGSSAAESADEERLASEMEQIFQEHALQKHIGSALTTPAPTLASPVAAQAAVEAANAQLRQPAPITAALPPHLSNARMTRGQD